MIATSIDPGLLGSIIGAVAAVIAAVLVTSRARKQQLNSIEVKVDGRLEKALETVDRLEGMIATLTGTTAPPPVAGQNVPLPTAASTVLATAANVAEGVLATAADKASALLEHPVP